MIRRTLLLPQGRLSYLEQGCAQEGQPSVVLIHGLMGTAATFAPLMRALGEDRHVLALDLPGAGASDRSARVSPALSSVAACVLGVLKALELERPVLVGHSHGGALALQLAASVPGRVSRLGLLAPAHPYFRHADQIIAFYLSPLGKVFAHALPWFPQWVHMLGLRQMAGPDTTEGPERLQPYRENLRTRGTVPHLLRLLRTWHSDMQELRQLLEAPFRVPTCLIWGDHDRAVPASTAPDLLRRLRTGELHVLPGVGHRPAEERPERCAEILARWMREDGAARRATVSAAD